jgi:FKBP-type peptidyl-prolyl cis-trans isomerase
VIEEHVAEPLEIDTRPASGVRKPPPELGIEDLAIGDGPTCDRPDDIVTIHYRGSLLDGRVFDSSYDRGKPIVAPLDSLIPGWQLGVPGMRVGGRRRLTVPAHLAYSGMAALSGISPSVTSGSGTILIPPESTLVFEIELLALGDPASEDVADISQRPRE